MTEDELKSYLDSDENVHGLDSVATHGFLVATVVGKPLPNWMSLLFEGEDDKVPTEVKDAIKTWRNEMIETLKNEEHIHLPIDLEMETDDIDFSPESELSAWAVGFVDAMYGDENVDWFEPNHETSSDDDTGEDVAMLTLPMMVFSGIDMADDVNDEDEELAAIRADKQAMAQMADSLEKNVTELFLLFNTQ